MKVVILAGGLGTRISEYTKFIPKPMIKVCGKPLIQRIIDHYVSYGHYEFFIAIGYKGYLIKNYFKNKKIDKKPIYFDKIFKKSYSAFQISRLIGLMFRFKFKPLFYDFTELKKLQFPNIRLFIHFLKVDLYKPIIYYLRSNLR